MVQWWALRRGPPDCDEPDLDYLERAIRLVSCDGCGEPAGVACRNYPSGLSIANAHNGRYYKALDAGMLPALNCLDPLHTID